VEKESLLRCCSRDRRRGKARSTKVGGFGSSANPKEDIVAADNSVLKEDLAFWPPFNVREKERRTKRHRHVERQSRHDTIGRGFGKCNSMRHSSQGGKSGKEKAGRRERRRGLRSVCVQYARFRKKRRGRTRERKPKPKSPRSGRIIFSPSFLSTDKKSRPFTGKQMKKMREKRMTGMWSTRALRGAYLTVKAHPEIWMQKGRCAKKGAHS